MEAGPEVPDGPHYPGPWEGEPERADWVILIGVALSGLYALALLPVVPALLGSHPVLLEIVSGSTAAVVTVAAQARVGQGSLVVAVLAAVPGCMMFDWLFWWAGARWGHRSLSLVLGARRSRRRARLEARVERFAHRWAAPAVVLAYYLPVPNPVTYVAAGIGGMRLRTFLLLDAIATLLWVGALAALGWALGQRAVDVVDRISHYSLLLTLIVLAGVVGVLLLRRVRAGRA